MPTLPEELLALIIEQLASPNVFVVDEQLEELYEQQKRDERSRMISDHSARISTLRNLCLASNSMHRLAWPVLYRDFHNRRLRDVNGSDHTAYETPTRRLLRTICLTPHYGHALRNLLIKAWVPIDAMRGDEVLRLLQCDATVSAIFQWRTRGYWFENGAFLDSWHRALSLGHEDGLVTLLLVMCPNIRELEMEPPIDFRQSLFTNLLEIVHRESFEKKPCPAMVHDVEEDEADYMVAQMFGVPWPDQKLQKPPFLHSLSKLTLWSPGLENLPSETIVQILTLPSLISFEAWGINSKYRYEPFFERQSNLRSLELHCSVGTAELKGIFAICPKLEELALTWEHFDNDPDFHLDYSEIAHTLALRTPDLRKLTLDANQLWYDTGAGWEPLSRQPILRQLDYLKKLEHLTLDTRAIYGPEYQNDGSCVAENVPKRVTNLTLVSPEYDRDDDMLDAYLDRQDVDLVALLQDSTFDRLSSVYRKGRAKMLPRDRATAEKHGWEIQPRVPDEESMRLVNASRLRTEPASSTTHTT